MLVNMKEILKDAEEKGYAIGCINTPNMETLRAVVDAAEELNVPIIIDHAQVHDPLIPMESIGPKMVEYAKQAKVPVCVHLDCFHMIREETSYREAVLTCGKEYLGYVHVCENNRGIPGTGLVPWEEFFTALHDIGYEGPCVIESFDPSFEELNANCAIWRKFADTGEELAVQGLANLKRIAAGLGV